jgi:protein-tyrosine phosphatase
MGIGMIQSVLFVCAQNVCRSPLMAAAFEEQFSAETDRESDEVEWVFGSAGTQAEPGKRSCRFAVDIVPAASGHRSARLEADDLDAADLVIAASLVERALIAQLRPNVRTRTFTLREALLLGETSISAGSLEEYAAGLDSRRGTLDLPSRRRLPWQRDAAHPLDVVDVHHLRPGAHRRGLEKAAADARTLASRLHRDLIPRA